MAGCAAHEDAAGHRFCCLQGEVLQCLVGAVGMTSSACSRETVRAVHTGLQFYMPVSAVHMASCDIMTTKMRLWKL